MRIPIHNTGYRTNLITFINKCNIQYIYLRFGLIGPGVEHFGLCELVGRGERYTYTKRKNIFFLFIISIKIMFCPLTSYHPFGGGLFGFGVGANIVDGHFGGARWWWADVGGLS